jgi:hypothetical protein
MAETSDQIQLHIQRTREDLNDNITELQQKVKSAVNWRSQFDERPLTMIGLAFGAGVLLAAIVPRRNGNSRRQPTVADSDASGDAARVPSRRASAYGTVTSPTSETWEALKGALAGVATNWIGEFLNHYLPGFKQEFSRVRTSRTNQQTGA